MEKPKKPYENFPLTPHPNGSWCKKVKGKLYYFGKWDSPDEALAEYVDKMSSLGLKYEIKELTSNLIVNGEITIRLGGSDYKISFGVSKSQVETRGPSKASESRTFVYIMKHSNGLFKIGRSRNPKAREKTLQSEDPQLEMIHCFESSEEVESRLHEIFDEIRVRGEWFRLSDHHIDWIANILGRANSNTKP